MNKAWYSHVPACEQMPNFYILLNWYFTQRPSAFTIRVVRISFLAEIAEKKSQIPDSMENVRKQKESQSFCNFMTLHSVLWMHKALDGRNLQAGQIWNKNCINSSNVNWGQMAGWLPLIHDLILVSFSLAEGCPSGRVMLRSRGKYWTCYRSHTPETMILWGCEEEGGCVF